jgi:hypothetical protein
MNSENANYLLGILKKKKNSSKKEESNNVNTSNKKNNNSNVLIQQLMQIQKNIKNEEGETEMMEERVNQMKNQSNEMKNQSNEMKNQSNKKKSFKNILLRVIEKLEDDVDVVSKKIEEFNEEKKSIMEMNQKEIKRLKTLVRKLYKTILTIYESLDVNKNTRVELLQRLKRNIESNKTFLQNIQEINMIRGYVPNKMNMNEKEEIEMAEVVEPSEEEEVVMANTEVSNKTSNSQNQKSNLTIFNLIEKNKPETPSSTPVVEETSSETSSESEESKEPKEMKEKRLNMSKKVSRKLNEMPSITNQQARNSLNQFLRDRMPRMNQSSSTPSTTPSTTNKIEPVVYSNKPSQNTSKPPSQNSNNSKNVATPVSSVNISQSNQNKKNNSNIFI